MQRTSTAFGAWASISERARQVIYSQTRFGSLGFHLAFSAAPSWSPSWHLRWPHLGICSGLGGASKWWGVRCTPLDAIDFAKRAFVQASWPISYAELAICYENAAEFFGVASADFIAPIPPWERLEGVRFEDLER